MVGIAATHTYAHAATGLDATSASEVMSALHVVKASGRTICVSIHQPRASVFADFDRLLLLYQGSGARRYSS